VQADIGHGDLEAVLAPYEFDCVIHSAALIHVGWRRQAESLQVNRDGTQAIVDWASHRRIRGVYVSTVNTLPIGEAVKPKTERCTGDGQIRSAYVLSKRAAQKVIDRAVEQGDDWYSVFPGFMLGPYDWQLSSGRMVLALQRFQPWAPSGGCSVCDPRDVATAMLRLARSGATERRFILAGDNLTYFDLWTRIATQLGSRPPAVAMRRPARAIGPLLADGVNFFRRKESDFNSAAIRMGQQFHYYDSRLAGEHLGYATRPTEDSIRDAIQWLRDAGHLPPTG
jgi:dihydroflavonol-4-reductase